MFKRALLFLCGAVVFGAAQTSGDRQFDYAVARYQAAKHATVSRIQRKELEMARRDFQRFVASFPKDKRSDQARAYMRAIEAELRSGTLEATKLNPIAVEPRENGVRVRLKPSRRTAYKVNHLSADPALGLPARVYVDLDSVEALDDTTTSVTANHPLLRGVRVGRPSPDKARVVLDLNTPLDQADYQVTPEGSDIVVTLSARPAEPKSSGAQSVSGQVTSVVRPAVAPTGPETSLLKALPPVPEKRGRLRIILDAGHGGEDTGAVGPTGFEEKEVTLAITKRLYRLFEKHPKFDVVMTRADDRALALGERTEFANHMQGDLFLSIHANANPKSTARGVSTYFLNNADDHEALRVARRENGELALPAQSQATGQIPEDYFLEVMKASLEKNFHTTQSTDLAYVVQKEMVSHLRQRYRNVQDLGVKSAGFYVLTGAKMPAILVETSFISNPTEEKRLKQTAYQDTLAKAIYKAVLTYTKLKDKRTHAGLM